MRRLTLSQVEELSLKGPFNGMGKWAADLDQSGPDYVITWPGTDRDGVPVNNLLGNTNAPAAASGVNMLAAAALASAATTLKSSFLTQPDYARNVRLATLLAGANMDAGTVAVIIGKDIQGNVITENVDVSGAAGNKDSLNAYSQVTSILLPGYKTSGDTISAGYGPALGLPHVFYADGGLIFCQDNAQTTYTLVKSATLLAANLVTPQNALNAARKYLFAYKRLRYGT